LDELKELYRCNDENARVILDRRLQTTDTTDNDVHVWRSDNTARWM